MIRRLVALGLAALIPGASASAFPPYRSTDADTAEMVKLMNKAVKRIPAERLWVNPDCGLKTRAWPETEAALVNMVAAARLLRSQLA